MHRTDKRGKTQRTPATRLVLASGSPRRAELMRARGYDVDVIQPPIDEPSRLNPTLAPPQLAQALSFFKARAVAEVVHDAWIIAGDTIATLKGTVFGKPIDRADARRILTTIADTTHDVITGVTLYDPVARDRLIQHDVTHVTMRSLSEDEIEAYLNTGAWQEKAGAYGIQDRGDAFIERIEGSFSNVVGFPMELIERMLSQWGYDSLHELRA
jgi:septum formation protein